MTQVIVLLGREGTESKDETQFLAWVEYCDARMGELLPDDIELELETRSERDQVQTDVINGLDRWAVDAVADLKQACWDDWCSGIQLGKGLSDERSGSDTSLD